MVSAEQYILKHGGGDNIEWYKTYCYMFNLNELIINSYCWSILIKCYAVEFATVSLNIISSLLQFTQSQISAFLFYHSVDFCCLVFVDTGQSETILKTLILMTLVDFKLVPIFFLLPFFHLVYLLSINSHLCLIQALVMVANLYRQHFCDLCSIISVNGNDFIYFSRPNKQGNQNILRKPLHVHHPQLMLLIER